MAPGSIVDPAQPEFVHPLKDAFTEQHVVAGFNGSSCNQRHIQKAG